MLRVVLLLAFAAGLAAEEQVDLAAIHRIKQEGLKRSQVMDHAFYLTDVHGPRLTASPGLRAAAEWVLGKYREWGLANPRLEPWGPFGRGWSQVRFSAHLKEPRYAPLIGYARPWSPSTPGPVSASPILAVIKTAADLPKFRGKLQGRIVLLEEPRELKPIDTPLNRVLSAADLSRLFDVVNPLSQAYHDEVFPPRKPAPPYSSEKGRRLANRIHCFLKEEGAVAALIPGERMDGGTVRATGPAFLRDERNPAPPPLAALTPEDYNRIARLLEKKIPVTVELDIQTRYHTESPDSFNVIAELPGGDKADEIVMLGAHFDSWTGGTGATDNAAGSAVVIEAMRILKSSGLKPRRTIRAALWSGEEQGLLGSKAYVKENFGDPADMRLKPAHGKLAAYFNLDNGSGMIRGVYLQGNDMVRPIFAAWLKPFEDLGANTLTIRNTTGTDHLSFDAVGLPGFQFIQDPLEYATRTHHTNMDVYDRLQPKGLQQAAVVMASFAYHAAMRDEMLPRKPLPEPRGLEGFHEDILYSEAHQLKLDAYVPPGDGPFPAAVVVHGGGFAQGDKRTDMGPVLDTLVEGDFAFFAINYRLAPRHRYPAALEDVESAFAWVQANAGRYKIDPKRMALIGGSAGGYLVSMAGARGKVKPRAVVAFYAVHDFAKRVRDAGKVNENQEGFFGLTDIRSPRWGEVSPVNLVHAGLPPYLLIHGTRDEQVPFAQSELMCAAIKKAGASCELFSVENGGHGVNGWEKDPDLLRYKPRLTEWLREALKP